MRSLTKFPRLPADQEERLRSLAADLRQPVEISDDGRIRVEAKVSLPTEHGHFDVRLFHFEGGPEEQLAISCGDVTGAEPLPVRIHSECFTSEVLGSLKCDCDDQLSFALSTSRRMGRGLVLYLRQEGRGIGLANKLRAYALQNAGADTVDANRLLGLPDDARRYDAAAAMLKHLGVGAVRLMTNNPAKVRALEALGVRVVDRIPVLAASNPLAAQYLETKRERMQHQVPVQLSVVPRG